MCVLSARFISACLSHCSTTFSGRGPASPVRQLADLTQGSVKPLVTLSCFSLRASELYMLLSRCHTLVHHTRNHSSYSVSNTQLQQLISATEQVRSRDGAKKWRKYRNEAFVLQLQVDFKERLDNSETVEIQGSRELTSLLVRSICINQTHLLCTNLNVNCCFSTTVVVAECFSQLVASFVSNVIRSRRQRGAEYPLVRATQQPNSSARAD